MVNVLIVGSINMDVVNRVHHHPHPGETIHGLGTRYSPGGKGANQAVAAALAGGNAAILGAVGQDPFGKKLISSLQQYHVQTGSVLEKEGTSGLAFITVDDTGENSIIVSAGSNGKLSVEDIHQSHSLFEDKDIVLLQNEIPWETTRYTIEVAHQNGVKVYLNPAPAFLVPKDIYPYIHILVVNETEAELMTGLAVANEQQAGAAANKLIEDGVQGVILTLGEKGSIYMNAEGHTLYTPSFKVEPTDTTSAGDAFIGAFAASDQKDYSLEQRLRYASAAAAIAVTREGAQQSIPTQKEIEVFLDSHI